MDTNKRILGRIIRVDNEGYGFISSKDIEFTRIFFHWTALQQDTLNFKELKVGMKCEFTPIEFPGKGWRAMRVKILNDSIEGNEGEIKNDVSPLQE